MAVSAGMFLRATKLVRFEQCSFHATRVRNTSRVGSRINVLQRLTYLGVIFVLFPLMIWTGLAMSPAIASAFPAAVTVFGGQQSARTIHFFGSVILVLFLVVHIVMVCLAGFRNRMRDMITGRAGAQKEHP
jgi:thiosulfate reductase cytochrome b subunit